MHCVCVIRYTSSLHIDVYDTTEGGGVLHKMFGSWVQHTKKWTYSDLRFCENEGSKRSKINEIGGHLD